MSFQSGINGKVVQNFTFSLTFMIKMKIRIDPKMPNFHRDLRRSDKPFVQTTPRTYFTIDIEKTCGNLHFWL
jgi:hypothetical protein